MDYVALGQKLWQTPPQFLQYNHLCPAHAGVLIVTFKQITSEIMKMIINDLKRDRGLKLAFNSTHSGYNTKLHVTILLIQEVSRLICMRKGGIFRPVYYIQC